MTRHTETVQRVFWECSLCLRRIREPSCLGFSPPPDGGYPYAIHGGMTPDPELKRQVATSGDIHLCVACVTRIKEST